MYPALPAVDGVTHRYVRAGELRVHVAEAGPPDAPPVVLLHGWPQHWYCWRRVVPLLSTDHRLVMPDLRGFGWTSAPPKGYDKQQLTTDLFATLDALRLERVVLVGHDWGGWVGFLACLQRPERFAAHLALGVVHPYQQLDARVLQWWRFHYQLLLSAPVLSEQLLRRSPRLVTSVVRGGATVQSAFTGADLREYAAVLQDQPRARASVALYRTWLTREGLLATKKASRHRLTVPTRLVVGADDPVIRPQFLPGWEDAADDMAVEVVEGVGHFVPEEAPERVASHVRALDAAYVGR